MRKIDHNLYQKAYDAYQQHCIKTGIPFREPSEPLSSMGWKWIHLRNNSVEVAKYNRWTGEVVDNEGE